MNHFSRHWNEYIYIYHQIRNKIMLNWNIRDIFNSIKIITSATTSHQENIINIGNSRIALNMKPHRNHGDLLDSTCNVKEWVSKICQGVNSYIPLVKFESTLKTDDWKKWAVSSCLYHSNDLLNGINEHLVHQLQCYQNNSARILSMRHKYDHMAPELKQVH